MTAKKRRSRFWEGIPPDIRCLCQAAIYGAESYHCTGAVIDALLKHLDDCDTFYIDRSPFDVVRCVDAAFESCLFPLELHDDEWETFAEPLGNILEHAEALLRRAGPRDIDEGWVSPYPSRRGPDSVRLLQKLNVYFAVLYMYTGSERLPERLEKVLEDTKRNVRQMRTYANDLRYVSEDDWTEFHYPGADMDRFSTVMWPAREFLPLGAPRMLFTETFEKYALYLEALNGENGGCAQYVHLQKNAEKRLQRLCEYVADELDDRMDFGEEPQETLLADEQRFLEMQRRSEERLEKLNAWQPPAENERTRYTAFISDDLPF